MRLITLTIRITCILRSLFDLLVREQGNLGKENPPLKKLNTNLCKLFWQLVEDFGYRLPDDKHKSYMFELVSPKTKLTLAVCYHFLEFLR